MYLINIFINKEEEKSSRGQLKRGNEILLSPKNGPSGLVQRCPSTPYKGYLKNSPNLTSWVQSGVKV